MGEVFLVVEFHRGGFATNEATQSSSLTMSVTFM